MIQINSKINTEVDEDSSNWFIRFMKWIYNHIIAPIGRFFKRMFS